MEEKIKVLMESLKITREEAIQVIEDDKRIDKGEKLFELPDELKAGAKKARSTGTRKTTGTTKKEKKVNNEKKNLIEVMRSAVESEEMTESIVVNNDEREFIFVYNGTKYKVVMSCPRS
jgi:hypothetical protein